MSLSSSSKLKYSLRNSSTADLRLYVRELSDTFGKKRPLVVRTWSTVKDVKDALSQLLHIPPSALRLYYGSNGSNILTSASLGQELPNYRSLSDAGIYKNGDTILYEVKSNQGTSLSSTTSVNDICITSSLIDLAPRSLVKIVQLAKRGFARGIKPELVMDGTGGTYFLHDARKVKVAVFKPEDEEPYAENNPRGYVSASRSFNSSTSSSNDAASMRAGIKPGDACLREVAAYLLDHDGFCDVPATTLAEARHPSFHLNGSRLKVSEGGASIGTHSLWSSNESPAEISPISHRGPTTPQLPKKVGSFQEYIAAECTMDDLSPSKIPVDEVHKIAILDIRLLNADRNAANLLVVRKFNSDTGHDDLTLVPIDHGYCLRAVADVAWFDWCWLEWSQLKQPLSEKTKDYVLKKINIEEDIQLLRDRLHLPQTALDYYRSSTKLLQEGVRAGMTLYDIAIICCRNDDSGILPSKLERLTMMASDIALSAVENTKWDFGTTKKGSFSQLVRRQSHDCRTRRYGMAPSRKLSLLSDLVKSVSNMNFSSLNLIDPYSESGLSKSDSSVPTPLSPSSDSGSSSSDCDDERNKVQTVPVDNYVDDNTSLSDFEAFLELGGLVPNSIRHVDNEASLNSSNLNRSSSSDEGDDASYNLSTSPVGFWTIPPSSNKASKTEKEIEWSPCMSPMISPSSFEGNRPGLLGRMSPMVLPPSSMITQLEPDKPPSLPMKRSVSYSAPLYHLPRTNDIGMDKSTGMDPWSIDRDERTNETSKHNSNIMRSMSDVDTSGLLGEYYIKFVDLLIARLTATESSRRNKVHELDMSPPSKAGRSPSIESESGGFSWNGYSEDLAQSVS